MLERAAIGDRGFELTYQDVGTGPPVVFVHGFSDTHLSWWQQIPTFREDYRCLALDQRGFGCSPDPTDRGVSAFPEDLAALLDRLGVDRAALLGHSMGGWTVGSFASQYPERVAALVLSATPGGLVAPDRHRELMAAGADAIPDVDPLTPELAFLDDAIAALNRDAPDDWEQTRARLDELPLDGERVRDGEFPVQVIAGEADEFMPGPAVEAVADRLDADAAVVEGAAHSVFFDQPSAFNCRVKAFLDSEATF